MTSYIKRNLRCCCCGEYAGKWQQWWNQDTGFGICVACVDWMRKPLPSTGQPRETEENIRDYYGVQGVNWGLMDLDRRANG